jgi:hypothetical protein
MGRVVDTAENEQRCICGTCPSYPGEGGVFCAKGKSTKEIAQRGCLCSDCENFKQFLLSDGYFCVTGAPMHEYPPCGLAAV